MTMGEGGAVYTDNPLLHRIVPLLPRLGTGTVSVRQERTISADTVFDRQYGELPLGYDHKYVYSHFGYNLKATDMQAAVGCAQLEKFPGFVQRRRHNFARLRKGLEGMEDRFILPEPCPRFWSKLVRLPSDLP